MHYEQGADLTDDTITTLSRTVLRAELAAIRTAPHTRATVWIGLLIGLELAAMTALISRNVTAAWWALPIALPVGVWLAVWATARMGAARTYRAAWRVAWIDNERGVAVARIRRDQDRHQVEGVAAWPLDRGLGGELMGQLLERTDAEQIPLELHASSQRVASFYQRLGFTATSHRRDRRLGYPMRRPACIAADPAYGGVTEHTPSVSAGFHSEAPQTPHPRHP